MEINVLKGARRRGAFLSLAFFILLSPSLALACACCGLDDWWSTATVPANGYEAELVGKLQLGPGEFVLPGDEAPSWIISTVKREAKGFVFRSDVGPFLFHTMKAPEHRMVDVTFITPAKTKLFDSAAIYHEIVYVGVLHLPTRASKYLKLSRIEATLVLRGVGNMCFETGTLNRWLITTQKPGFRGAGVLLGETQKP